MDEAQAAPGTVTTSSTSDGDPRGPDGRADPRATARRRRVRLLQRYVLNPPVRLATRLGWVPGHVLVETVGRTTARRRRTVVGAQLEGDTAWIVAEQGPHAGYVRNLVAEPRVRVCVGGRWHPGVARLAPEVDPDRLLDSWGRPVHAGSVRRFGTALRVVRIDLAADQTGRPPGAPCGGGLRRWWYRGRRPHRTARLLNRLSAAQFAAGVLSPARAVTLEVRGRRSGRTVSLPVVVADHDGKRYLVAMLGERAQWVQNVRAAGGRAVLRRRGREEVRLEEVEPDDRAPVLRRYLALAPGARAHVPVDRWAPLEEFERIAPCFPVFRVVPWAASGEEPAGAAARPDVSPTPRTRHRAPRPEVDGVVAPGFEPVRDAFLANLTERHELGGAVCAVVDGEVVVDLRGGVRDEATGAPWRRDTMTLVHSSTKGLSAAVLALLHSRGLLDYDERVATYWPEFARAGKEDITVRQLLAHQAGLFAFDEPVDRDVVADLDRLAGVMERQRPAWPPGDRQAYHAITLGFYENELVRRLDPGHRTIGRVLAEDVAAPLGVGDEVYLGTPSSVPDERLAALVPPPLWARVTGMPLRSTIDAMRRRSVLYRSLVANPGTGFYVDPEHVIVRELEVPSGGAVATARALATVYGAFASAGGPLALRPETLEALAALATPPRRGWYDECLRGPARFSLGFMKPSVGLDFGSDAAFGAPGAGGSMGFADPTRRLGYGYVTDRMGTRLQGDPRDLALRAALGTVLARGA